MKTIMKVAANIVTLFVMTIMSIFMGIGFVNFMENGGMEMINEVVAEHVTVEEHFEGISIGKDGITTITSKELVFR